jgi:hypothetical protein
MASALSPEFRLALACSRWPPSAQRDRDVAEAAVDSLDWEKFLRIVRRQRVEGMVGAALKRSHAPVPEPISSALSGASSAIAHENLLHTAASLRLQDAFEAAGISILHVKGITLSLLAYGTLSIKKARDIDIVVPAEAIGAAFELLRRTSHRCLSAGGKAGGAADDVPMNAAKETVWQDPSGLLVELHSGLVDNPMMLPGVGVHSPVQWVEVAPGRRLPTLRKDELFAYLCVHGATHAWSRLKWLADVAALVSVDDGAEIERLYRRSIELGAGRSSAQALLLCARLLATPVPPHLLEELSSDPPTRWLVRVALRSMNGETELDATVLGTIPIHVSHFLLKRGREYKYAELKRKSAGRPTASHGAMPRFLRFLGPLVAVPLWLRSRAKERIRR